MIPRLSSIYIVICENWKLNFEYNFVCILMIILLSVYKLLIQIKNLLLGFLIDHSSLKEDPPLKKINWFIWANIILDIFLFLNFKIGYCDFENMCQKRGHQDGKDCSKEYKFPLVSVFSHIRLINNDKHMYPSSWACLFGRTVQNSLC
jgi:hypothetical protein